MVPHFDYGDTVYCTTSMYNLDRLQKLQNSACRSILGRERDTSVKELHRDLSLLTLESRRFIHMGMECHKSVHSEGGYSLSQFFVPLANVRQRQTRASIAKRMHVPRAKTNVGHKAIRIRGPVFWNTLSEHLVDIEDCKSFKREISYTMSLANELGNQNFPT